MFNQVKAKAEKGDAEAQLALGSLYARGTGVSRDFKRAAKWHRKAAEQGLAPAEYQLGLDYSDGEGVKTDKVEALRWFQMAAEQGMPQAQFALGLAFANGRGTAEDPVEAVKWFRRASDQGNADAQYELGNCYLEGTGVPKDTAVGVRWIRQAAEAGCARAQNCLGICYDQGRGMPKDPVQAYKWLSLAAAQGGGDAPDIRVSLAKVEAGLTPDQITQAQSLAAQFRPTQAPAAGGAAGLTPGAVMPLGALTGAVNVVTPEGVCDIFIDGSFVGNSPARLVLTQGTHLVEVKRAGFKEYRRELKVGAGSDLTLRPVLEQE
jgi:TPR repeat protein